MGVISSGLVNFAAEYEISPILLVGGIAANAKGGALPISTFTQGPQSNSGFSITGLVEAAASGAVAGVTGVLSTATGYLSSALGPAEPQSFAHFQPLPGGSLIDNQVAMYPFANQTVAANAIITQPLAVSMLMRCPASSSVPYSQKLTLIQALQTALAQHNALGGTYTVFTPAYIYTNCLLTAMRDVSGGESKQPQYDFQLDFLQPLVTLQQAQQAQNALMKTLSNGAAPATPSTTSNPAGVSVPGIAPGVPIGNPTGIPLSGALA